MIQITNGVLTVKLEGLEAHDPLISIILKRYERVLAEKTQVIYEIERLKSTSAKPYVFSFSEN
jgi:hypothetical protein